LHLFVVCQLPALNSLKYNQAASNLDADKIHGWFQLAERSDDVPPAIRHNTVLVPPSVPQQVTSGRQPGLIPITLATSGPLPHERKYLAAVGPLSSEMKYPDIHVAPHGGTTRASYRRTRHDSAGTGPRTAMLAWPTTVDRAPAAATNFSAGGSLRQKSNDTCRPREMTFGAGRAGMPPSDYSQKRDRTAACELEYRV